MMVQDIAARRVAVVTGAARGIGRAVAERLARDGFDIAVLDLDEVACGDTVEAVRAVGARGLAVAVDVADEESVQHGMVRVARELGSPVVLVNNAGITRDNLLFKMSLADWDSVMNVHLRGAFLMSKECQRYMTEAGWGRIINLSSGSALGNRGQANYAAAKAGLQGFTKTLAIELGKFGVTVNAVAPGFVATDMTQATAERMGVSFEEYTESVASAIPVRRVGTPADIAAVVSFFAGDESGYVSGQVIYAAGGPLS